MRKIITSLYIYKSQLFISQLNGVIEKLDLETSYKNIQPTHDIDFNLNFSGEIIIDIKAFKDKYYILTRKGVYCYSNNILEKLKQISDAQVLTVDSKTGVLFIFSDTRGLIGMNLYNNSYIDDIPLIKLEGLFREEQIPVTSIVSYDGVIFLSILSKGVYRIDYKNRNNQLDFSNFLKIQLKLPQDIYYIEEDKELAIIDYDLGLVIVNINNGYTRTYNLPNEDVAYTIKSLKTRNKRYYVIQSRNALYKFNRDRHTFSIIENKKVSNLITYYNKIYYTYKGQYEEKTI